MYGRRRGNGAAGHGHSHGAVDPSITSSREGLGALKWSFVGLMATAAIQLVVYAMSGSIALLADTIHNFADAATAIPLGIAFWLARRGTTRRFTYGLGRVEDLAGLLIIATILASAVVAAYEAIRRFFDPQPIELLWAVMLAAVVGFVGNEAVAIFRIRTGRRIGSAALVADGYHARIETSTLDTIAHAARHVGGVEDVSEVRARWLGHRMHIDVSVTVSAHLSVAEGHDIARRVRHQLLHHVAHLGHVNVHVDPSGQGGEAHHRIGEHAHDDLPPHTHD